ncbi:MAG: SUMF1/EgtB/PvdO family nonheme iron enzyme [Saprospiraceae bacterium]
MKRYPGIRPFRTDEQHLFFGRDADTERLLRLIDLQQVVILYGKSGYGKSSLLSAGVFPRLLSEGSLRPWEIRLGPCKPGESLAPAEALRQAIVRQTTSDNPLLPPGFAGEAGIWQALKNLQTPTGKRFLLVFDQFEELFTYPPEQVLEFKKQLAEALFSIVPKRYEKALALAKLSPETEDALYAPFELKVVFSIRADRMSLLNGLKDYLPNLLQHGYELDALDEASAKEAVLRPARLANAEFGMANAELANAELGIRNAESQAASSSFIVHRSSFDTPPFSYAPEALAAIFAALRDERGRIETSTLQIVCKHVEDNIIGPWTMDNGRLTAETNPPLSPSHVSHPLTISPSDLGDISAIFGDFYENTLAALTEEEQPIARHLVEDVLIKDGIRLPFAEQALLALPGVSADLLQRLAAASLLRVERDDQGRMLYEVGHDTLVRPIEEAAKARREAEKREAEELRLREEALAAEAQLAQEAERQRQERKKIEAGRRRNLLVGLGALALLAFAFYQTWVASQARQKAELAIRAAEAMSNLAEENKHRAEEKTLEADSIRLEVDKAKSRIDTARMQVLLAENATAQQKQLARKNLEEAEQAGVKVVYFILDNAKQQIKALDYPAADTILRSAIELVGSRPPSSPLGPMRPLVAKALMEPAFFFHETGKTAKADSLAADIAGLLASSDGVTSSHPVTTHTFSGLSNLESLQTTLKALRAKYYGVFADVPGGTDTIGGAVIYGDTIPALVVTVSPFRLATTETTWWQYNLFCNATGYPQPTKPGWGSDGDNPVVNVSWYDVVVYANWRSHREGLQPAYTIDSVGRSQDEGWDVALVSLPDGEGRGGAGFRLPKEAEWEYAARAGTDFEYAGDSLLQNVGWYGENSGSRTHPVAGKKPNGLGLYDMSGNVWEWCWDRYGAYPEGPVKDYRGPDEGPSRVLRGGAWNFINDYCFVSWRNNLDDWNRYYSVGSRLAQDE